MKRRSFLRSLVGGVACAAAVRTFPFRVFSFPSEIQRLRPIMYCDLEPFVQPIYDIYSLCSTIPNSKTLFTMLAADEMLGD
jgi:hypothetical protein